MFAIEGVGEVRLERGQVEMEVRPRRAIGGQRIAVYDGAAGGIVGTGRVEGVTGIGRSGERGVVVRLSEVTILPEVVPCEAPELRAVWTLPAEIEQQVMDAWAAEPPAEEEEVESGA